MTHSKKHQALTARQAARSGSAKPLAFARSLLLTASLTVSLAAFAVSPTISTAQEKNPSANSSAFTPLDLDKCHLLTRAELGLPELSEEEEGVDGGSWLCIGYARSIVYVAEGDLRMFVSYGPDALRERAASQTLPEFNYLGDKIEWRLRPSENGEKGSGTPFAIIVTWIIESGDSTQESAEVLVVTKLEPGNTCHVAYIDSSLVPNAHDVALWYADNEVDGFNCATDDVLVVPT